jgi:hypothetical protein
LAKRKRGVAGWINDKGVNKGKTSITRFVRAATVAAAESLIEE